MDSWVEKARWLEPIGQTFAVAAFGVQFFYVDPASTDLMRGYFGREDASLARIERRIAGTYKPTLLDSLLVTPLLETAPIEIADTKTPVATLAVRIVRIRRRPDGSGQVRVHQILEAMNAGIARQFPDPEGQQFGPLHTARAGLAVKLATATAPSASASRAKTSNPRMAIPERFQQEGVPQFASAGRASRVATAATTPARARVRKAKAKNLRMMTSQTFQQFAPVQVARAGLASKAETTTAPPVRANARRARARSFRMAISERFQQLAPLQTASAGRAASVVTTAMPPARAKSARATKAKFFIERLSFIRINSRSRA